MNRLCFNLLFFILTVCRLFGQNENNIWLFSHHIQIDFNTGTINYSKTPNNVVVRSENGAVVCDKDGNLLFYTSGEELWNGNHQLITNGGDLGGNNSTTQGTIVIQSVNTKDQYHLFTLESAGTSDGSNLYHSILDMNALNGNGEVIQLKKK